MYICTCVCSFFVDNSLVPSLSLHVNAKPNNVIFLKVLSYHPFKLRKPASTSKSKSSSDAEGSQKSSIKDVKDEL